MTRASGRNIGKVFNPVVKLVLENQPFLIGINAYNLYTSYVVSKLGQGFHYVYSTCNPSLMIDHLLHICTFLLTVQCTAILVKTHVLDQQAHTTYIHTVYAAIGSHLCAHSYIQETSFVVTMDWNVESRI